MACPNGLQLLLHLFVLLCLFTAVPQPSAPLSSMRHPPHPPAASSCLASRQQLGVWSAAHEPPPPGSPKLPLAFAVPVHPPTFPYTLHLLYAAFTHPGQFDVYLIFTSPEDAALYLLFLSQQPRTPPNATLDTGAPRLPAPGLLWEALYTPLVLRWPCHSSQDLADRKVIITAKKLYAVALLHACYQLLVTCDAETAVLRPGGVLAAATAAAASLPLIVATWVPNYADMVAASVAMFPPADLAAIRAATHDFALWSWWNQLPVWRAEEVPAFLAYIDFPARTPQAFNEFDHLTYTAWRVLHRGASLVLLAAPGLDGPFGNTAEPAHWSAAAALSPPGPVWMTLHFCRRNPAFCASQPSIALLHHLDRGETPWWRSGWEAGHMAATVEEAPAAGSGSCALAGRTQLLTLLQEEEPE